MKKTGIALGVKCAKKFKMDQMDEDGPNGLSALSKNKIVHSVYLVYLVHEMLVSLPADPTGIRLDREYFKLKIYQLSEISSGKSI